VGLLQLLLHSLLVLVKISIQLMELSRLLKGLISLPCEGEKTMASDSNVYDRIKQTQRKRLLTSQLGKLFIPLAGRTSRALTRCSQLLHQRSSQIILLLELPLESKKLLKLL